MNNPNDLFSHEFSIRDAKRSDIDDILILGTLLNTLNLPADKAELEQVIALSEASFSENALGSMAGSFLFVLVNSDDRVIGSSQIFAKHGSLESPHYFFQVGQDERYSETLKKYLRHQTLHLRQNFDGPTEIGSLVLAKPYRSLPAKLGRNLSFVRFLFIAMRPKLFAQRILAELLPPLGPNLESALWDAVGRKFTGLDYYEADMLSRKNKEFIKSLFPNNEIYVSLLPQSAQDIIGQVGRNSRAAAHLLSQIGFRYSHRVDPFDGGPHYEAEQSEISLITQAIHASAGTSSGQISHPGDPAFRFGLIANFNASKNSGERFRAIVAPYFFARAEQKVYLSPTNLKTLGLSFGDPVSVIDMTNI